jgi:hypothetical protein
MQAARPFLTAMAGAVKGRLLERIGHPFAIDSRPLMIVGELY